MMARVKSIKRYVEQDFPLLECPFNDLQST